MPPVHLHLGIMRIAEARGGFRSGLAAIGLLLVAALPSRLGCLLRGKTLTIEALESMLAGGVLDAAEVIWLLPVGILILSLLVPLLLRRARTTTWQRIGPPACSLPFGMTLWVLTVMAQEFRFERGGFPTVLDLQEGADSSFIQGIAGYLRYESIWIPAAAGLTLTLVIWVPIAVRRTTKTDPWGAWTLGLAAGLLGAASLLPASAWALGTASSRFTPGGLGSPLPVVIESASDWLRGRGPSTPRQLVLDAELPRSMAIEGARLVGWPPQDPTASPSRRRPLDLAAEPPGADPRIRALPQAFARLGEALFSDDAPNVAFFQLSLEGFRGDDLHGLNPAAPTEVAPFTNGLYERPPGVLVATTLYQAGVRTAHCLGAMTCGLGTLPYNLTFIRDLQPFPVRCASDVLRDAGFAHSFFYGSDASFDHVLSFLRSHGYSKIVSQAELPKGLPLGTWDAVTDRAVFREAAKTVAEALSSGPQFALIMSLSNHSPFTIPQDLPTRVTERVDQALALHAHRATSDDRLRLLTYSYTDAALEQLFADLSAVGIADRSIVMLMADHSTGHHFLWSDDDSGSDHAKAQIPFALVIPAPFLERAKDPVGLAAALRDAQARIEEGPVSQNDVPTLILALLGAHPQVRSLPAAKRWHTLGGQVTSPWFQPGGAEASYLLGINAISQLYVLNRHGDRVGNYEESIFLQSRADRYRITPRLIPVTALLAETMKTDEPR